MIDHYMGKYPQIHPSVFVAKNATIIGDVKIDEGSSVWFQTVIRGDVEPTIIGKRVNIQDLSLIHQSPNLPVIIEDDVSIGHQVTLHACTIRQGALIGMGATILDKVEIGKRAFIGAGSLVTPGTIIPENTLAFGSPAKVVRELTEADFKEMDRIQQTYIDKCAYYKQNTTSGLNF